MSIAYPKFLRVLSVCIATGLSLLDTALVYGAEHAAPAFDEAVMAQLRRNPFRADIHWPQTAPSVQWQSMQKRNFPHRCTQARNNLLICSSVQNPEQHCNLSAIELDTGRLVWEDRVNGACLLDEAAGLFSPFVDSNGNVYSGDSQRIVSFSPGGQLRWQMNHPSQINVLLGNKLLNAPAGIAMLPSGELISISRGDGLVLVMDPATGKLVNDGLDISAVKFPDELFPPRPAGLLETLASRRGADLLWDMAFGQSDNAIDSEIAVDPVSGLILFNSAAPYPNNHHYGALWAVSYHPVYKKLAVAFFVPYLGPGTSPLSPVISPDGRFAVIVNHRRQLVLVDMVSCARLSPGSDCRFFLTYPLSDTLQHAPVINDQNRVFISDGRAGLRAIDVHRLTGYGDGQLQANTAWTLQAPGSSLPLFDEKGFSFLQTNSYSAPVQAYPGLLLTTLTSTRLRRIDWDNRHPDSWFLGDSSSTLQFINPENGEIIRQLPAPANLSYLQLSADGSKLIGQAYSFDNELRGGAATQAGLQAWTFRADSE